jgi:site-specific recombinase XerD
MSQDKNPSSQIAIRFKQDLQLKGLGERTQQSYCRALRKFTEFIQLEPDSATEDDLRRYLLFIKNERQFSASSINVAQNGLKNFFKMTCPRDWPTLKFLRVKGEQKLPTVLTIGEVHTILKLIEKPSMACFFLTSFMVLASRQPKASSRPSWVSLTGTTVASARIHCDIAMPRIYWKRV